MLRTTTLSAAALLGLTLLAPMSAGAAGETCQGVAATHVGSVNVYELEGTEGPDVIVTNGARVTDALGGDDLVCVTGVASRVLAGSGDDVVHSLAEGEFGARIELGPGSDHFIGTSAVDMVWGGDKAGRGQVDTDRDVLDGGQGSTLYLDTTDARSVTIGTRAGSCSRNDSSAALVGFDHFRLTDQDGPRYVTFRGSDRSETNRIHRRVTTFDGGTGHDQIGIVMPGKEVRLDLRRGRLLAGKTRRAVAAKARGFEDAEVVASLIVMTGTRRDNDLRADGCQVEVRALAGDDKVSPLTLLYDRLLTCRTERARFEGGPGADVLVGEKGVDVLVGGPGRDVADGGSGRDICHAERTRRCEVRR